MKKFAILTVLGALALTGCESDDEDGPTAPDGAALFEIQVQDEAFTLAAEDPNVIDQLEARMASDTEGVILGELARGDAGYNDPWSWHLVPGTIEVPDVAVEVCDGRPSLVESNLEYWIDTVQRYCPWSARVVERLD